MAIFSPKTDVFFYYPDREKTVTLQQLLAGGQIENFLSPQVSQ